MYYVLFNDFTFFSIIRFSMVTYYTYYVVKYILSEIYFKCCYHICNYIIPKYAVLYHIMK